MNPDDLHEAMMAMPESWRYRWCEAGLCGCMGGANCSGRLAGRFSREQWAQWVAEHPDPRPSQPAFEIRSLKW